MATLIFGFRLSLDALINRELDRLVVEFVDADGEVGGDDVDEMNIQKCFSYCAASCELLVLFEEKGTKLIQKYQSRNLENQKNISLKFFAKLIFLR